MRSSLRSSLLATASACLVAACATTSEHGSMAKQPAAPATTSTSTAKSATVNLAPASGSLVSGTLTIVPQGAGVHITGQVGGLPPDSAHGFHIHETGDCSAADAKSAGGHFNPTNAAHGRSGAGPHHAGDMDNITANAQGVATINVQNNDVSLGGGAANDSAGRAIIIHADPDDYTSQPSGNAGARVACGVINATM